MKRATRYASMLGPRVRRFRGVGDVLSRVFAAVREHYPNARMEGSTGYERTFEVPGPDRGDWFLVAHAWGTLSAVNDLETWRLRMKE